MKQKIEQPDVQKVEVAPHAGAWIETTAVIPEGAVIQSPPMRGRGLKRRVGGDRQAPRHVSPPMRGRGLKQWFCKAI